MPGILPASPLQTHRGHETHRLRRAGVKGTMTDTETKPEYMTVGELALKIRMSQQYVRKAVKHKKLFAIRQGSRIRIPIRAAEEFARGTTNPPGGRDGR